MIRIVGVFVVCCWLLAGAPAQAQAQTPAPDALAFSVGYFDVLDKDDTAAEGRVEYRFGKTYWIFKPLAGLMVTSDGGVFGYGGVGIDIPLGNQFVLTPSFAPGLYSDGGGKDLGHAVEFRSQIELAYILANGSRVAVSFNHISNSSIGNHNPGTESLALTYVVPVSWVFGR
jgi:hypothetical protein